MTERRIEFFEHGFNDTPHTPAQLDALREHQLRDFFKACREAWPDSPIYVDHGFSPYVPREPIKRPGAPDKAKARRRAKKKAAHRARIAQRRKA